LCDGGAPEFSLTKPSQRNATTGRAGCIPKGHGDINLPEIIVSYNIFQATRLDSVRKKTAVESIKRKIKKFGYPKIKEKIDQICVIWDHWPEQEKQYIPMCSTFFNGERFLDDLETFTQRLTPQTKLLALNTARNGREKALTTQSSKNPEEIIKKVLTLVKTEENFFSIDLMDQHLHHAIEMKGGWQELKYQVNKDANLGPQLLDLYKIAKERDMRKAMVYGTNEPRPIKLLL